MRDVYEAISFINEYIFISASSFPQRSCSISLSTDLTLIFKRVKCTKHNTKDKRRMICVLAT
jgi:hypothetical protein